MGEAHCAGFDGNIGAWQEERSDSKTGAERFLGFSTRFRRREARPDRFIREEFAKNQTTKKPWAEVEPCSNIWTARLPAALQAGTHCIVVRAVDEYRREHHDRLCIEVTAAHAIRG